MSEHELVRKNRSVPERAAECVSYFRPGLDIPRHHRMGLGSPSCLSTNKVIEIQMVSKERRDRDQKNTESSSILTLFYIKNSCICHGGRPVGQSDVEARDTDPGEEPPLPSLRELSNAFNLSIQSEQGRRFNSKVAWTAILWEKGDRLVPKNRLLALPRIWAGEAGFLPWTLAAPVPVSWESEIFIVRQPSSVSLSAREECSHGKCGFAYQE